jgi:hypothetical protein
MLNGFYRLFIHSCLTLKGFLPGIFKQKCKVTVGASEILRIMAFGQVTICASEILGAWQFGAREFLSYGVFFLATVMQRDMKIETSRRRRFLSGVCTKAFVGPLMSAESTHKLTSVWCLLKHEIIRKASGKKVISLLVSLSCPEVSRPHVRYLSYLSCVQFLNHKPL